MRFPNKVATLWFVLTIVAAGIAVLGCHHSKAPVKIGLAIDLTGPEGADGQRVREAAELAIDEINARGGPNGRPLQLLVVDTVALAEGGLTADQKLIDQGVLAIIGHSTGRDSLPPAATSAASGKALLLSPYAGATRLAGHDDLFFSTAVNNTVYAKALAALLSRRHLDNVAFLLDSTNQNLVGDYQDLILKNFAGLVREEKITPSPAIDWPTVMSGLLANKPQAVILLAGTGMTGLACQRLKAANYEGEIIATVWAQSPELLDYGLQAVDGLTILTFVNPDNKRPAFRQFDHSLRQRYNTFPRAKSVRAYEAVHILAAALTRCPPNPTAADLKEALLAEPFETLLGPLHFDRFGDVIRPMYIVRIHNGRFHNAGEVVVN